MAVYELSIVLKDGHGKEFGGSQGTWDLQLLGSGDRGYNVLIELNDNCVDLAAERS